MSRLGVGAVAGQGFRPGGWEVGASILASEFVVFRSESGRSSCDVVRLW